MAERLTLDDIGCWVIKSQTPVVELSAGWDLGATRELTRCLRRSYRVHLMHPGQPCLLWVSGLQQPGVQALGELTSVARPVDDPEATRPQISVDVALRRLRRPIPRSALLADHVLAAAEVLRMPAGSNPSFLSPSLWAALQDFLDAEEAG
ncbi:MAG TPA: hypothetical protein VEQ66_04325 [Propionibacteriaceae bacterium]|nr:hypothetical protein [Propionibacteriaceae bacterium]